MELIWKSTNLASWLFDMYSFLNRSLSKETVSKGKKRKKNIDEGEEENYEQKPRKLFAKEENIKSLLPIKTSHGVIPQMTQIKQGMFSL